MYNMTFSLLRVFYMTLQIEFIQHDGKPINFYTAGMTHGSVLDAVEAARELMLSEREQAIQRYKAQMQIKPPRRRVTTD